MRVARVERNSAGFRAGIRPGDTVLRVNGEAVLHELDFSFLSAAAAFTVELVRRGQTRRVCVERRSARALGVTLSQKPIARCPNRCIFCFVDQLPRGMRKRLYIKDEDVRHSFLNGNYVTLCGAARRDLERIARYRLSPLYISVHATDTRVRTRMLRNPRAAAILDQLRFLERNGIAFHAQIVVCPGINDGAVLRRTLSALRRFRSGLLSLAVVPVGLTRHRSNGLRPVSRGEAARVVALVEKYSDEDRRGTRVRRIFASDEFYLTAGLSVPPRSYYGDYPQIENGVGLVRRLLDRWRSLKPSLGTACRSGRGRAKPWRALVATSKDASPFLERIVLDINAALPSACIEVAAVENRFFGDTVTVAVLLT